MNKKSNPKSGFKLGYIFIIVLVLVSGAISWSLYFKEYHQADTVSIHEFPKTIGEWTSTEIPITEDEYAILETKNAFTRTYKHPSGKAVTVLLVYSQHNRKVSHPPEICYTGSGATVVSKMPVELNVSPYKIKANQLAIELGDAKQTMYYWFKVGDEFTGNYWKQQLLIGIKSILGQAASSALIRLTADVNENGPLQAQKDIEEFAQIVTPLLFQYLP